MTKIYFSSVAKSASTKGRFLLTLVLFLLTVGLAFAQNEPVSKGKNMRTLINSEWEGIRRNNDIYIELGSGYKHYNWENGSANFEQLIHKYSIITGINFIKPIKYYPLLKTTFSLNYQLDRAQALKRNNGNVYFSNLNIEGQILLKYIGIGGVVSVNACSWMTGYSPGNYSKNDISFSLLNVSPVLWLGYSTKRYSIGIKTYTPISSVFFENPNNAAWPFLHPTKTQNNYSAKGFFLSFKFLHLKKKEKS